MSFSSFLPQEDPQWSQALAAVNADSDNLDLWEHLVAVTENLGGGLDSRSNMASKECARSVFDRLLGKFPLLFGYWNKYAEIELKFSGISGAQKVFEKAVAAFPSSIDIWTTYITVMIDSKRKSEKDGFVKLRILFKRAANLIGRDFLSHPFWDKYLEFEDSLDQDGLETVKILARIIHYPMHQYARYYERFSGLYEKFKVEEFLSKEDLENFKQSNSNAGTAEETPSDSDSSAVRSYVQNIFSSTQKATLDRWVFESKITRSYFHVIELEPDQLINWKEYLDYEESQGDFEQTRFLYERAVIPGALYDSLWLRYTRWMARQSHPSAIEETSNIYRRAVMLFVPISRPFIRYEYALFEESRGNVISSRDILNSIQKLLPNNEEPFIYRVHFERRVQSPSAAITYIDQLLNSETKHDPNSGSSLPWVDEVHITNANVKAVLCSLKAHILWKDLSDIDKARALFKKSSKTYLDSRFLWINYFEFELSLARKTSIQEINQIQQPAQQPAQQSAELKHNGDISVSSSSPSLFPSSHLFILWEQLTSISHLPQKVISDLSTLYLDALSSASNPQTGITNARKYLEVDEETNGPFSARIRLKRKLDTSGDETLVNRRLALENGHPGVEIGPFNVAYQGENPLAKYFAQQGDNVAY